MGLSTSVLSAIHGGVNHLAGLADHLARNKRAIVKAVQVLKGRALLTIVAANDFDRVVDKTVPPTRYVLTEAGEQQAISGMKISPGQGERRCKKTIGLRERAWWEMRNKGTANLKQIVTTHADGSEKAAEVNVYKYLVALEKAGILARQGKRLTTRKGNERVQWRLVLDLGVKAPVWRNRAQEVYDPNSEKVFPIAAADVDGGSDE